MAKAFELARIILFARDVRALVEYYERIFGLRVKSRSDDNRFVELHGGACVLAIHYGTPAGAVRGQPKIVFGAEDVDAARTELVARGAKIGKTTVFGELRFCDGRDPEGNAFQVSNRR